MSSTSPPFPPQVSAIAARCLPRKRADAVPSRRRPIAFCCGRHRLWHVSLLIEPEQGQVAQRGAQRHVNAAIERGADRGGRCGATSRFAGAARRRCSTSFASWGTCTGRCAPGSSGRSAPGFGKSSRSCRSGSEESDDVWVCRGCELQFEWLYGRVPHPTPTHTTHSPYLITHYHFLSPPTPRALLLGLRKMSALESAVLQVNSEIVLVSDF
jgi:hypothetical protein